MRRALSRRELFEGALAASGAWLFGCDANETEVLPPGGACAVESRFAGGAFVGVVPFSDDGDLPLDVPTGAGLDGRLYTDLSKLEYGARVVDNDRFYIRTRYPDRLDPNAPWVIRVSSGAGAPVDLTLADLAPRVRPMGVHVLECSGNARGGSFGLLSAAEWAGVPLAPVLRDRAAPAPEGTRVLVSGFDDHSQPSVRSVPGASWIFTWADLERAGAFLATEMNGVPLPRDHGAPVRLLVPGWYGCTCIKWVNAIALVGEAEPSTAHMREFASRTMQDGVPELARDYRPATIDQAAMPLRVERWRVEGRTIYRVLGVMWGGDRPTDRLTIRFGDLAPERVDVCPPQASNASFSWWTHGWVPPAPGPYAIRLGVDDPTIVARRLAGGYYARTIVVDA